MDTEFKLKQQLIEASNEVLGFVILYLGDCAKTAFILIGFQLLGWCFHLMQIAGMPEQYVVLLERIDFLFKMGTVMVCGTDFLVRLVVSMWRGIRNE